ncbi:SRPBCC family protein [Mycobacterium sp.]|uniref:SRPBCC family protein n=1 Tax=Mycobacterium sp. TaxID=1785 RepID=UPI003C73B333
MALLEASVLIARPVGDVWEYVTTAENLPVWVPVLHQVTQVTDGPVAVGTRWRGTMRLLGVAFTALVEFTRCEPNNAAEFTSVEAKFRFSSAITFEEVDGKTRFTYRTETASGFDGIFGKLARPIVSGASKRALGASLKNLARALSANG